MGGLFSKTPWELKVGELQPEMKTEAIIGPVTLSRQYSEEFGMDVYIFGDIHVINPHCPESISKSKAESLGGFLKRLASIQPEGNPYDLFLEHELSMVAEQKPLKELGTYRSDNFMSRLEKQLSQKPKGVRVHYVDIRPLGKTSMLQKLFLHMNKLNLGWYEKEMPTKVFTKYLSNISKFSGVETEKFEEFLSDLRINKQLEKVIDRQYIAERLVDYYKPIIENLLKCVNFTVKSVYDKWQQLSLDAKEEIKTTIFQYLYMLKIIVLKSQACFMDMYTIGRMIKNPVGPSGVEEPPRKIILYAGNAHSSRIRDFFHSIGFNTINATESYFQGNNQCLDISNFSQPFFTSFVVPDEEMDLPLDGLEDHSQLVEDFCETVDDLLNAFDKFSG